MASLRFIMDFHDDESHAPHSNRDQGADSAAPVVATGQDINQASAAAQTKRCRGSSGAGDPDVAAAMPPSPSPWPSPSPSPSSSWPWSSSSLPQWDPCPSRTSTGVMDQTRYASTAPSPSLGGPLQRPMPLRPAAAQLPSRITPKTGRVSKAQKGLPVHVCNTCTPPKTFTRAEHLRRHQLGHRNPQFRCPGCDRTFHRADLLARHQQKYEHEGGEAYKAGPAQTAAAALRVQQSPGHRPSNPPRATEAAPPPSAAYSRSPMVQPQGGEGDYRPRTGPPPIYLPTQGLQLPSLPVFVGSYSISISQPPEQPFGDALLDVRPMDYAASHHHHHHHHHQAPLTGSSASTFLHHYPHGGSISPGP